MAVVGSFAPGSAFAGHAVVYETGVFRVEGKGRIELEVLRQSEARGHFAWASPQMREWAESLSAGGSTPTPAAASIPPEAQDASGIAPSGTQGSGTRALKVGVVLTAVLALALFAFGAILVFAPDRGLRGNVIGNVVRPVDGPVDGPVEGPVDGPVDGPVEGPVDDPYEEPYEEPYQEPIEQPQYTQTAGITIRLATIQIPMQGTNGTVIIQSTTADFRAESNGKTIAGPTGAIDITDNEKKSGTIKQTPARAAAVKDLITQLQNDGWAVTARGAEWWDVRLSR